MNAVTLDASTEDRAAPRFPDGLSPEAARLITAAPTINTQGTYLPYYQLLDFAPDFQRALKDMPRQTDHYGALETLIAWSIAEALDAIPILSVRFWRTLSHHSALCEAASILLHDEYECLHHRLAEELTLFGLAQDLETRFENIFPNLWTGHYTLSGQVADQIDPLVGTSLLTKIGSGDISAETTGLTPVRLSHVVDTLTARPPAQRGGQ